ncbi:carbon-nitrogen hydrolase [Dipodascopsis tothii]|uniref:carbon-nitrogen hydrolase n=1 Tax=Dipodascopsis tothii TaxID=44089 RepID=UPI0034D00693
MEISIACLQNAPVIGQTAANMAEADRLLEPLVAAAARGSRVDVLVAPELALSGYLFADADAIAGELEDDSAQARTTAWALRTSEALGGAAVVAGFAELAGGRRYNSAVVAQSGRVVHKYRKHFLYHVDERWAEEGPGFSTFELNVRGTPVTTAVGICMDLNPRAFKAPFEAYEFARFAAGAGARLLLCPMAWQATDRHLGAAADMATVRYWAQRLEPLVEQTEPTVFVAASRSGTEAEPDGSTVTYAGSSCVMTIGSGRVRAHGVLAAHATGVLTATAQIPRERVK